MVVGFFVAVYFNIPVKQIVCGKSEIPFRQPVFSWYIDCGNNFQSIGAAGNRITPCSWRIKRDVPGPFVQAVKGWNFKALAFICAPVKVFIGNRLEVITISSTVLVASFDSAPDMLWVKSNKTERQNNNRKFLATVPPFIAKWKISRPCHKEAYGACGFNQTKIPDRLSDPGFPFFIRRFTPGHDLADVVEPLASVQAGLLTYGSIYLLRLPDFNDQWHYAAFVPVYSGGPVPDFHGIPC